MLLMLCDLCISHIFKHPNNFKCLLSTKLPVSSRETLWQNAKKMYKACNYGRNLLDLSNWIFFYIESTLVKDQKTRISSHMAPECWQTWLTVNLSNDDMLWTCLIWTRFIKSFRLAALRQPSPLSPHSPFPVIKLRSMTGHVKQTTWITYADEVAWYSDSRSPRSPAVARWHVPDMCGRRRQSESLSTSDLHIQQSRLTSLVFHTYGTNKWDTRVVYTGGQALPARWLSPVRSGCL